MVSKAISGKAPVSQTMERWKPNCLLLARFLYKLNVSVVGSETPPLPCDGNRLRLCPIQEASAVKRKGQRSLSDGIWRPNLAFVEKAAQSGPYLGSVYIVSGIV